MARKDGSSKRWLQPGCLVIGAVVGIAAVVGATLVVTALGQIRSERPQQRTVEHATSSDRLDDGRLVEEALAAIGRGMVELDVAIAQVIVVPARAGAPVHVDARYDPDRYELDERFERSSNTDWSYRIRFAPNGSSTMALLRIKMGGPLPKLRITLPRGVRLVLTGEIRGGMGSLELGGLTVESTELRVGGGAVALSFLEPLAEPMDSLTLLGDKGSVEVTGLGNASPARTRIEQRLGEIDLDLRGQWVRDGEVRIGAYLAGGSIWLPDNATIEGLEDRLGRAGQQTELPRPVLQFSLERRGGSLALVE